MPIIFALVTQVTDTTEEGTLLKYKRQWWSDWGEIYGEKPDV